MRLLRSCFLSLILSVGGFSWAEAQSELHFLTEHSPPSQYINDAGEIDGVTIRLILHLQQQLDERLRFTLLPWARALEQAKAAPNTVLFETVRTDEREQQFQWVGPVKFFDMQLYTLPEVVVYPDDFTRAKLRACAYRSSAQLAFFKQHGFEEGRNLSVVANAHECLVMAERGRAEVIAVNALRYGEWLQLGDVRLQRWQPLYHSYLYLAFSPSIPAERVERWQGALKQSYLDGTMRRLYQSDYPAEMIEQLEQYWQAEY